MIGTAHYPNPNLSPLGHLLLNVGRTPSLALVTRRLRHRDIQSIQYPFLSFHSVILASCYPSFLLHKIAPLEVCIRMDNGIQVGSPP